jgi:hypothetical protein
MGYLEDYPTQFNFTKRVRQRVNAIQRRHPWQTYANTYYDHPPGFNRYYERVSVDFWGGGGDSAETYSGYRGKPLPKALGDEIFNELFYAERGPAIDWIIWSGAMWWSPATGGPGWTSAPSGPADSDPGHYGHIHVTFIRGAGRLGGRHRAF